MNLDPAEYAKVQEFHGFRFVNPDLFNNYHIGNSPLLAQFQMPELGKSHCIDLSGWQLTELRGTGKSAW